MNLDQSLSQIYFVSNPLTSAYESDSLKNNKGIVKYGFRNNLITSASVDTIKKIRMFCFTAPSANRVANRSYFSSTIIREVYKLLTTACPSRKNTIIYGFIFSFLHNSFG